MTLSWRLRRLGVDLYHATHYTLPFRTPGRVVVTIHENPLTDKAKGGVLFADR